NQFYAMSEERMMRLQKDLLEAGYYDDAYYDEDDPVPIEAGWADADTATAYATLLHEAVILGKTPAEVLRRRKNSAQTRRKRERRGRGRGRGGGGGGGGGTT